MTSNRKTRGQSEFTRALHLSEGRCPTHGLGLAQDGLVYQGNYGIRMRGKHLGEAIGETVECPRRDCNFKHVPAVPGAKGAPGRLYRALHPEE